MQDNVSVCHTEEVEPRTGMPMATPMELEDEPGLTISNDLMMADGFGEAMDLNPSMLASRATKMFMEGTGAPRQNASNP